AAAVLEERQGDGDLRARQVGERRPQLVRGDAFSPAGLDELSNRLQYIHGAMLRVGAAVLEPYLTHEPATPNFKDDFPLRTSHCLLLRVRQRKLTSVGLLEPGFLALGGDLFD